MAEKDGVDLSRYDSPGGVDDTSACDDPRAQFGLLNVEDPGFANKVARMVDIGKPWGPYSWLYGERGGEECIDRMLRAVDSVSGRYGLPGRGGWADYEANGVQPVHATQARVRAQTSPFPVGLYTYLYLLNSQPGLAAEWWQWVLRWIAYYPGDNSGAFPSAQIGDAQAWGSVLWQYASSNGTRDRDWVVDDALWATLGTPTGQEDDDMKDLYITKTSDPNVGIWVTNGMHKRHVLPDEWSFVQYVHGGNTPVVKLSDQWWDSIPDAAPASVLTQRDLINIVAVVKPLISVGGGGSAPTKFNVSLTSTGLAVAA